MTFRMKTLGAVLAAAALVVASGLATDGFAGPGCGSKDAKASSSGCPSMKAGTCPSASKGCASSGAACGTAKTTQASTGACSKGQAMTQSAELKLPEGTRMTRVDVDGGIDMIFTSADLAAVETTLAAHMSLCGEPVSADGKRACGQTCTMTRTENSVVLSLRGDKAENCCQTWMQAASLTGEPAKGKDAKKISKKS